MCFLNNDEPERYWFKYQGDGEPHDTSLERFYHINEISYKVLAFK